VFGVWNVWVCVCGAFVICVCVCVFLGSVMCGFVYVWVL